MQSTPTYQILQAETLPERAEVCGERMIGLGAEGVEHQEISESCTLVNAYFPILPAETDPKTQMSGLARQIEGWHLEAFHVELKTTLLDAPDFDWREADREANEPYTL